MKELKAARAERRFSEALSTVKTAIPQSHLINGHNPLALLHTALSEGVHNKTDEECLQLATGLKLGPFAGTRAPILTSRGSET